MNEHENKNIPQTDVDVDLEKVGEKVVAGGVSVDMYKSEMSDDTDNTCNIGDTVKIMETRPLNRDKRWCHVEIVEKAK